MIPWILKEKREGLFDLGDWLDKIPRPDRSGYLSVILSLVVAFSLATAVPYSDLDPRCLLPGVKCSTKETTEHAARKATWITFYPGPPGAKSHACTCHIDLHYTGKPVWHVRMESEETCDSEHDISTEWTAPYSPELSTTHDTNGIFFSIANPRISSSILVFGTGGEFTMSYGEGEYRLHCEDSKDNSPQQPEQQPLGLFLPLSGTLTTEDAK